MAGLFNSFKREFDSAAASITREVDSASRTISNKWDEHAQSPLLDNFRSTNVVQLISRSTGKSLQIVQTPTGQLTVDGVGAEGPQAFNASWTVMNEGRNTVRLHNNNNYLALKDGNLYVVNYPQPAVAGYETRFRLHQMSQTHVSLESANAADTGRHVGILANGLIKSPIACGRETDSHFGVRLIHNAYPTPPPPAAQPVKVVQGQGATVVHVQGQSGAKVTVLPPK